MNHPIEQQLIEENTKLKAEIAKLSPFKEWVRMQGRHAIWCRAARAFCSKIGCRNPECTCGLARLYELLKEL